MAVRSLPGCLATLLGVCAAVAFGLTVARLGPSPGWAEHATWLRGGLVAGSALGLGVAAWGMLSVGEAVGGRRGVVLAAGLALLSAPVLFAVTAEAYWARRSYISVWRADGASGAGDAGLWRGTLGGDCGYVTVVRVRLGADGRGEGTAVPTSVFSPLYTAVVALSPLDGPGSIPVRARLRDGRLEVWTTAECRDKPLLLDGCSARSTTPVPSCPGGGLPDDLQRRAYPSASACQSTEAGFWKAGESLGRAHVARL